MLLLLDSTVLINHLRERPVVAKVEHRARSGDVLATSAINIEEIARGARPDDQAGIARLFAGLVVLPIDQAAAELSGQWRGDYARHGRTLGQADCLIAATASVHGARLCTGNPEDFPMIELEHWPVGE